MTIGNHCMRAALTALLVAAGSTLAQGQNLVAVDIEASQPLGEALQTFADQSDLQVIFFSDITDGKESKALKGEYTAAQALHTLLADTGLSYTFLDESSVSVQPDVEEASEPSGNSRPMPSPVLMAQVSMTNDASGGQRDKESEDRQEAALSEADKDPDLEEIIVTGTHIRGANVGASPVIVFDREAIERSGFADATQLIQSLPQNFSGTVNEVNAVALSIQTTRDAASNSEAGTSADLRGLGPDATLVLLNGRRIAPGGAEGNFVDISMIPLTAVERVEVLTDGASAIYGSDALAGVINFILRDDYEGTEASLRYGAVTTGSLDEYQAAVTHGRSWAGGNALIAYEYFERTNLPSSDRPYAANSDLTALGGDNFGRQGGNPGTLVDIFTGQTAAVPSGQDGSSLTPEDFVIGTTNFANTRDGVDVFPTQERHSVFLSVEQDLTGGTSFFAEGRFSERAFAQANPPETRRLFVLPSNPFFVSPFGPAPLVAVDYTFDAEYGNLTTTGDVRNYGLTSGLDVQLPGTWRAEVYGSVNRSEAERTRGIISGGAELSAALMDPNPLTAFNPFGDGNSTNPATIEAIGINIRTDTKSEVQFASAKVDGDLFKLPGGAVKLAAGLEYREETLEQEQLRIPLIGESEFTPVATLDRRAKAVFGELFVPLVGENNRIPGFDSLELTLAARYEEYNDFGSTANPKLGIRWSPIDSLALRASYGTSFKAPLLAEINGEDPNLNAVFYFPFAAVPLLVPAGNNPDLQPEEADTFTAGLQVSPGFANELLLELTYFNIDFENRIDIPANNILTAFNNPDVFGPVITLDPSNEEVTGLVESAGYTGPPISGTDPTTGRVLIAGLPVGAIVDLRLQNIATSRIEGFDFAVKYGFESRIGRLDLAVHGSLLTKFDSQLTVTAPADDVLDTLSNPIDFRMRGSATWSNASGLSATAFINYADDYVDDVSEPNRTIASFTTVDLQLRYDTGSRSGSAWADNLVLSANVQNLFDEDPPFANNPSGVGFDDRNASALGRFVAVQLTKSF